LPNYRDMVTKHHCSENKDKTL